MTASMGRKPTNSITAIIFIKISDATDFFPSAFSFFCKSFSFLRNKNRKNLFIPEKTPLKNRLTPFAHFSTMKTTPSTTFPRLQSSTYTGTRTTCDILIKIRLKVFLDSIFRYFIFTIPAAISQLDHIA